MKFRRAKELNSIEKTAEKFGAQLSGIEYGTLLYMSLNEDELFLIFSYEHEKFKMLEERKEAEIDRRNQKFNS